MAGIGDATLNQALAEAFNAQSTFNLSDFNYNSDELLQVIFRHIKNTSFNGVTVSVEATRVCMVVYICLCVCVCEGVCLCV